MRHKHSGRKLNRSSAHRKALFCNMTKALLTYGKITTTEAKAKELRGYVEPLINLAAKAPEADVIAEKVSPAGVHARRRAYQMLGNHKLVQRLFTEIGPVYRGIPGGFTRITRLSAPRRGDNAPMVVIELIHNDTTPLASEQSA